MAPGLVQSASTGGASGTTLTVTLGAATTAGNTLVVCVGTVDGSDPIVSAVKLGGSAGNFAKAVAHDGAADSCEIWYDFNCAGGQTSVVITFTGDSGGSPSTAAVVMEWSGMLTTASADKTNFADSFSTSWSSGSSGTLSQAGELLIGAAAIQAAGVTLTPASPWTALSAVSGTGGDAIKLQVSYQVVSAATAQAYTGTISSNSAWNALVATFKAATSTTHSGTATLTGSGTLTGTGAFGGTAALSGSGTLAWSGSRILKATVLTGSGTLTGTVIGTISEAVALDGEGTLQGAAVGTVFESGALSGSGTLSVPGVKLGFQAALSGTGTLFVIGTGGTVQASAGASAPYAYPGTSQVAVAAPGSPYWQYLGTLGVVTALTYSFTCPGGADQLTATVMVPASYRNQMLNPGWQVRVTRGGHVVWTGKLDEPVPTAAGWTLTAVGDGNRGTDFRAVFSGTWPAGIPDDPVNEAIARGLPWVNAGIGSPAGMWLGQAQDSGSMTVTDLLNLLCTRGGLTWYANSQPGGRPGTDLSVFPLPTTVNRLLVVTDPAPRTLGGDINTLYLRYEIDDGVASSTSATYGLTSVQNAASVAAHGVIEDYMDLSSAGVMPAITAQTVGNYVLQNYQRASFAGPFTGSYGQLLNAGGVPVDPGTDQAGTVMRAILTDYGAGGEVSMAPVTWLTGAYLWDDFAQKFTVTPYQNLDQSLSGLLSMAGTVLTPVTVVA
jgi:hypothetical protein